MDITVANVVIKKYQVRKDFSRTCNICGDTESPTAGTLFHRLKFGLRKAFLYVSK